METPNFYIEDNLRKYFNTVIHIMFQLIVDKHQKKPLKPSDIKFCKQYFMDLKLNIQEGLNVYFIITQKHNRCIFYPDISHITNSSHNQDQILIQALDTIIAFLENLENHIDVDKDQYLANLNTIITPFL